MSKHPISESSLTRFANGTSSRGENRSVVFHMLRGCASCAAALKAILQPEIPAGAYDAMFERLSAKFQPPAEAAVLVFEPRSRPRPAARQVVAARR